MVSSAVLLLAVVNVLADNQRSFNQTYERVHGDVVVDAYTVRHVFEQLARKASVRKCVVGTGNVSVELYYHSTTTAANLDRYAYFYRDGSDLKVERGEIDPATFAHVSGTSGTQTIARNVTSVYFSQTRPCLHMHVVLNDGKQDLPVTVTAMRHNE